MSGSVKPIDKTSVHRITSGQVIVDLCSAVKELVENALDAGATSVEVRLKEHGSELIEVADNGSGISHVDYDSIALKYHTSKISTFEDVAKVQSFGFRGEALSSLCAVSTVVFTTRTKEQDAGMKLSFDSKGYLQGKEVAPRSPGTTASIKDLFKSLPVRAKAFKTNLKKEYVKLVHLLQAYAAVCTGVRFIATNQVKKAARTTIVSTQPKPGIKDNVAAIFGAKLASSLEPLDVANDKFSITGVISSAVKVGGKSNGHPQFLFLNSRPVDIPKAVRVVNEAYRSLSSPALAGYKAVFAINITVDCSMVDVNVTPDKRTVFVQQEAALLDLLRSSLEDLWDPTKWQGAQSLANSSAAQQPVSNSGKQQSLLSSARSIKLSAEACTPSQATPLGPSQPVTRVHPSGGPDTAEPAATSVTAAATPGSAAAPITPAPIISHSAAATCHSVAAGASVPASCIARQSFASEQEQLTDQRGCGAHDAAGDHRSPVVLTSPEASPDGKVGAVPLRPAAAAAGSRRGALAAALSGPGRSKASTCKADSEFVRVATAAAAATAGADASAGAHCSAAVPTRITGTRLLMRSPNKPPRLLAGNSMPAEVPAHNASVDNAANDRPAAAATASRGLHDAGLEAAERGVDVEVAGSGTGLPLAQSPTEIAVKSGAVSEHDSDAEVVCAVEDDGAQLISGDLETFGEHCEAGLHSRSAAAHGDVLEGGSVQDLDIEMLQDYGEDEAPSAAAGSPLRPKRGMACLADSPEAAAAPQPRKSARSQSIPDQHASGGAGYAGAHVGGHDGGGGGVDGESGRGAAARTKGSEGSPDDVDMQLRDLEVVRSVLNSGGVHACEAAGPRALTSTPCAGLVAEAAALPGGSADVALDMPEILQTDSKVHAEGGGPQQPAVEGGRQAACVDVASMRARRLAAAERQREMLRQNSRGCAVSGFKAASLQALRADGDGGNEQEAQAASELERRFNKHDFRGMVIHGQFNKGFIMASRGRDLFIIDQHASDEKYNFERLQDQLVLNKQPLIVPVDLGLASVDDMTVRENMDVFEKNGFGFVDDLESGMLRLASVPFSKGTTFGPDDVHEMISMIHNGESTRIYVGDKRKSHVATRCQIRPSRVRAMLAMRACRGSIMVGTALNRQQMQTTVERLAGLDGPWNCPHGRPTLRHVHTLSADA